MPDTDGSATADQQRAAEKRKAAADEAQAAREGWASDGDETPKKRTAPPKGRRGKKLDES